MFRHMLFTGTLGSSLDPISIKVPAALAPAPIKVPAALAQEADKNPSADAIPREVSNV